MAITSSETQVNKSYTVEFNATSSSYPLNTNPNSYLTIEIYDANDNLYHSVTNKSQGVNYPYTFNSNDVGDYTVVYKVYSGNPLNAPDQSNQIEFTVLEYQPTFTLPVVTCAELGKPFNFHPLDWNQNENGLCPVTEEDKEITYQRYEFDLATSGYVLKHSVTYSITEDAEITAPEDYAYQGGSWTPNKLAMVKFVVTVSNCSAAIEKSTVFPICGAWKIRRLVCGSYRIYNYKNSNITYSLYKGVNSVSPIKNNISVPAFSYDSIVLEDDAIYKIVADDITQYIFNYCAIESCMLDLHKRILLDDTLCDECKLDKVLYQKALRLLPTYETWKKLLDKDWVYDMQYKSTDVSGELTRLYDAEELYSELIKLCEECQSSTKKCNC